MIRRALIAVLLAGCGAEPASDDSSVAGAAGSGTGGAAVAPADSVSGRPACPATGSWSRCAVVERLDRAGLAPRLDSTAIAREEPLTVDGFLVRVGNAELEVYLYPDTRARSRDVARVDTTRYLGYTEAVSMQQLPTLIQSANLVAILHSRNDLQRERIGDMLTAGPPQPSGPTQLAPATSQPNRSP